MKYKIYKSIDNWIYVAFKYNCLRIINRLLLIFNKKVNLNLVIRYKNGMKMMIPSESLNNYFNPLSIYHEYFSEFKEHYPEFVINELDICIDIGAHIGFLLIPALIETPKINYYCFEADKNNYKRLKENIRLNKITSSNIIVENTAISDVDGEMEFIKGKTSTTGRLKNIKSYKIDDAVFSVDASPSIAKYLGLIYPKNLDGSVLNLKFDN